MSEKDLRELVQKVDVAGGPLHLLERARYDEVGIDMGDEGGWAQHMEDAVNRPSVQAQIVGSLKHDLVERRMYPGTIYRADVKWVAQVDKYVDPGDGPRYHGGVGYAERCDSEMEALLNAWLMAAYEEGWAATNER